MTKEDKCGLLGVLLCGAAAAIDPWWRPFWLACGLILAVWTAASLWRKFRA